MSDTNGQTTGSIMSPPAEALAPRKDDPITVEELKYFNGAALDIPIYVAIKGIIFDVSERRNTYGPGCTYHCFTAKDASRALGLGSLKEEDLLADYSTLDSNQLKVLDEWYTYFSKRYNIVGRVTDEATSG